MSTTDDLMRENAQLRAENTLLKSLLQANGIALPVIASDDCSTPHDDMSMDIAVTKRSPLPDRISLFLSLFQGRPDVFARRWESKNGRSGYSPACRNEWKHGVCLKPKGKCTDCSHAEYCAYDTAAVESHLSGCHVLGIYPLLQDETCRFLAIDFDEENWRGDVQMVRATCRGNDIPCSVEISRSGNGAHLWIFFSEPVEAAKARMLGSVILTLAMKEHARLSFHSYDRMFPNQDRLHEGKCEVRVYDYIDNHAVMLEKMYHKRLKGYASIGYSVSTEQQDVALGSDIIYDQITFQERFLQDIAQARESVVIVSPYVTSKRVRWIEAALQPCTQKQVNVSIITRTPTSLPVSSRKAGEIAIGLLRAYPIHIIFREGIHQKFAIIDGSIVWYGSINLLSFSTSQESIMRLHSSSIARALIDKAEGEAL